MRASELIAALRAADPDAEVYIRKLTEGTRAAKAAKPAPKGA